MTKKLAFSERMSGATHHCTYTNTSSYALAGVTSIGCTDGIMELRALYSVHTVLYIQRTALASAALLGNLDFCLLAALPTPYSTESTTVKAWHRNVTWRHSAQKLTHKFCVAAAVFQRETKRWMKCGTLSQRDQLRPPQHTVS
jgi:predicted metal-dependent HD superfamily phosphohydrolase